MAITLVGSKTFAHTATTAQAVPLTDLLNAAGQTVAAAAGDLVVVNITHAATASRTAAQLVASGYTQLGGALIANDTNVTSQLVCYKQLSAADASLTVPGVVTQTSTSMIVIIHVFRGVDATTPFDVAAVTTTGINGGQPNASAITPVTPGAWIVVAAGSAAATGVVFTQSGLSATTNHFRTATSPSATNKATGGTGLKVDWTSGAFDPPAWTGSSSVNTSSWAAQTFALRPAPSLSALTGSLSVDENSANGTVVGTPTGYTAGSTKSLSANPGGRFAIHATTGQITVADGSKLDYETTPQHIITIVETLSGATNSPKSTNLTIFINDVFDISTTNINNIEGQLLDEPLGIGGGAQGYLDGGSDFAQFWVNYDININDYRVSWANTITRDFENPLDADHNNVYEFTVDGLPFTVTVLNDTADDAAYLYLGAGNRASHYKGARANDIGFYLGTKPGIFPS